MFEMTENGWCWKPVREPSIVINTIFIVLTCLMSVGFMIYGEYRNRSNVVQREVQEALIREYQHTFTLFVGSLDNNGILPFEMWQQNITIEREIIRWRVVVENEIRWFGLSNYGIANLANFLRESSSSVTLRQMLDFIESRTVDVMGYI